MKWHVYFNENKRLSITEFNAVSISLLACPLFVASEPWSSYRRQERSSWRTRWPFLVRRSFLRLLLDFPERCLLLRLSNFGLDIS